MSAIALSSAAPTYDRLAPYYDGFTAGYAYQRWLDGLQTRAIGLGLAGNRALDVACGTGKSTEQLLARGYRITACDVSEEMLRVARRKFPDLAKSFIWADMRALPRLGEFDLVLCLDDALNYLLNVGELTDAFRGIASCLARQGIFVFDLNSLLTYRRTFSQTTVREEAGVFYAWQGESPADFASGEQATARVEIFSLQAPGHWQRVGVRHTQRHHPRGDVLRALEHAGLECCALAGQRPGAYLDDDFDEERHIKVVYFARRRAGTA